MDKEFDQYKLTKEPEPEKSSPPCKHDFTQDTGLIDKYDDSLCDKIIEFARKGYFIQGFCGKHNICSRTMYKVWLNRKDPTYAKFRSAVKTAQSALIAYYNEELIHAIENYTERGTTVSMLRGILSDLMKNTPKAILDLQFEDIDEEETADQEKERLAKEAKLRDYSAFRGIEIAQVIE